MKHSFNAIFKSYSRRELDTALLHCRAQQGDISFSILQWPHLNSKQNTVLAAIHLQRKARIRDYLSLPRKATTRRNPGVLHPTSCAQGERIPETCQKVLKQLSTEILINLGLCCCMGSWKAWQKSNAATGIEGNTKREGALHYEHSYSFPASPAHIPGHRFYMDSLCSCTTPQQLFSHKPLQGMVMQTTAGLPEKNWH